MQKRHIAVCDTCAERSPKNFTEHCARVWARDHARKHDHVVWFYGSKGVYVHQVNYERTRN